MLVTQQHCIKINILIKYKTAGRVQFIAPNNIKKESWLDSFLIAGTTSGFADGRHEVSPDSEEIEHIWTEGSIAKLSECGANPRQARRAESCNKKTLPKKCFNNGGADAFRFELLIFSYMKHLLSPNTDRICDLIEELGIIVWKIVTIVLKTLKFFKNMPIY